MATGAGKTFTMVTETYRLLRHAGARKVLFLVDRNNLGRQADSEFANYRTPDDGTPFNALYNVQRLRSGIVLDSTHVVISTVQRLYMMLRGDDVPGTDEPDRRSRAQARSTTPSRSSTTPRSRRRPSTS